MFKCGICDDGYRLENHECIKLHPCECENGVAKQYCVTRGENKCIGCNEGYSLVSNKQEEGKSCIAKCSCQNGAAEAFCEIPWENKCNSCHEGYNLVTTSTRNDGLPGCIAICTCKNGSPENYCETPWQNKCQACDEGYSLHGDKCLPVCTCKNGLPESICKFPFQNRCKSCDNNSGYALKISEEKCLPVCSCENGRNEDFCDFPFQNNCRSCSDGYALVGHSNAPKECIAKCSCQNGRAEDFCNTPWQNKCKSCNSGYELKGGTTCQEIPQTGKVCKNNKRWCDRYTNKYAYMSFGYCKRAVLGCIETHRRHYRRFREIRSWKSNCANTCREVRRKFYEDFEGNSKICGKWRLFDMKYNERARMMYYTVPAYQISFEAYLMTENPNSKYYYGNCIRGQKYNYDPNY